VQWLVYLDKHHRLTWAPSQGPGVRERFGLSREATNSMAWAVDASGRRFAGAGAVTQSVAVALGMPAIYAFYRLPLVKQLADAVYHWVGEHRHHIPGVTPYCQRGHPCPG
jgi:predicted DCC family thiol-disulfide oxidoreductase YuxK